MRTASKSLCNLDACKPDPEEPGGAVTQELQEETAQSSGLTSALGRASGLELVKGLVWGRGKRLRVVAFCYVTRKDASPKADSKEVAQASQRLVPTTLPQAGSHGDAGNLQELRTLGRCQ